MNNGKEFSITALSSQSYGTIQKNMVNQEPEQKNKDESVGNKSIKDNCGKVHENVHTVIHFTIN
jgi:hypothetical protein